MIAVPLLLSGSLLALLAGGFLPPLRSVPTAPIPLRAVLPCLLLALLGYAVAGPPEAGAGLSIGLGLLPWVRARKRRARLRQEEHVLATLLRNSLDALEGGEPPIAALAVAAGGLPSPWKEDILRTLEDPSAGLLPLTAWAHTRRHPGWGRFADLVEAAAAFGTPVSRALRQLDQGLTARTRRQGERRAKSLGFRILVGFFLAAQGAILLLLAIGSGHAIDLLRSGPGSWISVWCSGTSVAAVAAADLLGGSQA